MKNLLIIGAGGFGREIAFLIERINYVQKEYNIVGFIDDNVSKETCMNGYQIVGTTDDLLKWPTSINVVLAIGSTKTRTMVFEKLQDNNNLSWPNIIDPSAIVDENVIGKGNIVCAHNIFTVNYKMGDFNIINLSCTVGHDVLIHDYVTIYPGVNVSGNVEIKSNTEVGTGVKIIQGIHIGSNIIIGAGSTVIRNLDSDAVYAGVPTKKIK